MKIRITTLACILGISSILCQKATAQKESNQTRSPFYISLVALVVIPQGPLSSYSHTDGGFRLEGGKAFRKIPSLSRGIELSGAFSSAKKDTFKGLEVETNTSLFAIRPFLRWTSIKNKVVKPYFDLSAGIMTSSTETTSSIVDEASFLECVLFGTETSVETTTHKESSSSNLSLSIGAGVVIKNFFMIGVRFNHTNPVTYIDKDKVFVRDNNIQYNAKRIPLDTIEISFGISNWGSRK